MNKHEGKSRDDVDHQAHGGGDGRGAGIGQGEIGGVERPHAGEGGQAHAVGDQRPGRGGDGMPLMRAVVSTRPTMDPRRGEVRPHGQGARSM